MAVGILLGMSNPLSLESIEEHIIELRGQKVLLDSDVAEIYGVVTKRINEAVRNNPDKFPDGYLIKLDTTEWRILKSKLSTSSWGGKNKPPTAFTERGLYMLATILKSKRATEASILIIETYAKLRELTNTLSALSNAEDAQSKQSLMEASGQVLGQLLDSHLQTSESETSLELNFAVLKLKHRINRTKSD
jgi:hypothetical protein